MKIAKLLALALVGGTVLLPTPYLAEEQPAAESKISSDLPTCPFDPLPFSSARVLAYFNEAFGQRPFESDPGSYVYIDCTNPDEVVIVTVTELQTSIGVVLFATGDYGVNYIREFFEAPFFLREETEQLYKLLDSGLGIRSVTLKRFNIQIGMTAAEGWIVVAIEFSPPQLFRAHRALVTDRPAG